MAGWHHWLDGRESQWTPGVGDGQGSLSYCNSWGRKESDTTEQLIWSDLIVHLSLQVSECFKYWSYVLQPHLICLLLTVPIGFNGFSRIFYLQDYGFWSTAFIPSFPISLPLILFFAILFSLDPPIQFWKTVVKNGHLCLVLDIEKTVTPSQFKYNILARIFFFFKQPQMPLSSLLFIVYWLCLLGKGVEFCQIIFFYLLTQSYGFSPLIY